MAGTIQPFHRRKAVAPLKHHQHPALPDLVERFPSPKGGGPIEAACSSSAEGAGLGAFHRRKAVAPLKQLLSTGPAGRHRSFPSPKGGGPIEATRFPGRV